MRFNHRFEVLTFLTGRLRGRHELQIRPAASANLTDENIISYSDPNLPEGLDPSFLAALPENIRQEVIADHLRLQRIQQRTREQQNAVTPGGMEVNPEFLAALPPAIQEEVSITKW